MICVKLKYLPLFVYSVYKLIFYSRFQNFTAFYKNNLQIHFVRNFCSRQYLNPVPVYFYSYISPFEQTLGTLLNLSTLVFNLVLENSKIYVLRLDQFLK